MALRTKWKLPPARGHGPSHRSTVKALNADCMNCAPVMRDMLSSVYIRKVDRYCQAWCRTPIIPPPLGRLRQEDLSEFKAILECTVSLRPA